jgi:hypothetical protein
MASLLWGSTAASPRDADLDDGKPVCDVGPVLAKSQVAHIAKSLQRREFTRIYNEPDSNDVNATIYYI